MNGTNYGGRNSAVGIEGRLRAGRSGVRITAGRYLFPHGPGRLWVLPSLLFTGCRGSFAEISLPKRHATHSPPTSIETKSMVVYLYSPYTPTWRGVLDKFTFYPDNSLVRFLFTFKRQYRSAGLLFKCQTHGQSVTSQRTLTRKIHHSGLEVDQQETRPGKHVALDTTRAARVLKHFRKTYRSRFQFLGIQNRGH